MCSCLGSSTTGDDFGIFLVDVTTVSLRLEFRFRCACKLREPKPSHFVWLNLTANLQLKMFKSCEGEKLPALLSLLWFGTA